MIAVDRKAAKPLHKQIYDTYRTMIVGRDPQACDPELPVQEMQSMTSVIADSLWLKRLSATLIGLVAALAITLAAVGIYRVMSYSVGQRRKEVGIRIAFGADRRDILGMIIGETCRRMARDAPAFLHHADRLD